MCVVKCNRFTFLNKIRPLASFEIVIVKNNLLSYEHLDQCFQNFGLHPHYQIWQEWVQRYREILKNEKKKLDLTINS